MPGSLFYLALFFLDFWFTRDIQFGFVVCVDGFSLLFYFVPTK